jgi:hypothetical protein
VCVGLRTGKRTKKAQKVESGRKQKRRRTRTEEFKLDEREAWILLRYNESTKRHTHTYKTRIREAQKRSASERDIREHWQVFSRSPQANLWAEEWNE